MTANSARALRYKIERERFANLVVNARSQLTRVLPDAVNRATARMIHRHLPLICYLNVNANEAEGIEIVIPFAFVIYFAYNLQFQYRRRSCKL